MAHEYFLNGTFTCSSLVQAYVQVSSMYQDHALLAGLLLSYGDLTEVVLQRIAAYNQPTSINTIVTLNPSLGSEAARLDDELQSMMSSGAPLPSLFCVPFIVKVIQMTASYPAHWCPSSCRHHKELPRLHGFIIDSSACTCHMVEGRESRDELGWCRTTMMYVAPRQQLVLQPLWTISRSRTPPW